MRKPGRAVIGAATLLCPALALAAPGPTSAGGSQGCQDVNAIGFQHSISGTDRIVLSSHGFASGETVKLSATGANEPWRFVAGDGDDVDTSVRPYDSLISETVTIGPLGASYLWIARTTPGALIFTELRVTCQFLTQTQPDTVAEDARESLGFVSPAMAAALTAARASITAAAGANRMGGRAQAPDQTAANMAGMLGFAATALNRGRTPDRADAMSVEMAQLMGLHGPMVSFAGGDPDLGFGVWASGAFTRVAGRPTGGVYDGDGVVTMVGVDAQLTDTLVAGVALAYEYGSIDTRFDNGRIRSDGFGVSPYVVWAPRPGMMVDATLGLTTISYDTQRNDGAVRGDFDGRRVTGGLGVAQTFDFTEVSLTPRLRVDMLAERQQSYTDSNGDRVAGDTISTGIATAGVEVAREALLGEVAYRPFARADVEWAFVRPDAVTLATNERYRQQPLSGAATVGLQIEGTTGLSGRIELSHSGIGDDDLRATTVRVGLRFAF